MNVLIFLPFFLGSARIPPCPGSFSCDNRTCVNMSQVCNGVPDCPWGEDELVCGEFSQALATPKVVSMLKCGQKRYGQEYTVCLSVSILIMFSRLKKN